MILNQEWFFAPRGHLVASEDIFRCHNWGGSGIGLQWVEARSAAKYPIMHRVIGYSATHNKDLSDPKYPKYWVWEILL